MKRGRKPSTGATKSVLLSVRVTQEVSDRLEALRVPEEVDSSLVTRVLIAGLESLEVADADAAKPLPS